MAMRYNHIKESVKYTFLVVELESFPHIILSRKFTNRAETSRRPLELIYSSSPE